MIRRRKRRRGVLIIRRVVVVALTVALVIIAIADVAVEVVVAQQARPQVVARRRRGVAEAARCGERAALVAEVIGVERDVRPEDEPVRHADVLSDSRVQPLDAELAARAVVVVWRVRPHHPRGAVGRERPERVRHGARARRVADPDELTVAHGVEDAIAALSMDAPGKDGKRVNLKAAYKEYEERELARVKEDQPGLKLSQYKEIVYKAWQKSPENPMLSG